MPLKRVRGFPDHLAEESGQFDSLLSTIIEVLKVFDFQKVDPPILEYSELFSRTLGRDSEIVNKEMYSFQQGEESLTLRPEGTAGIARLFITQKLYKQLPLKWYYQGYMFRHERPQKGRFRQFYQLGAEFLGDSSELADLEVLSMAWLLVKKLSLEKKVTLEINSLGSLKERKKYREKLQDFLSTQKEKLSADSQVRLIQNPLRIWDSKEKQDQEIMKEAPLLKDSLQNQTIQRYERIKEGLTSLNIPFKENAQLVRGLDYYDDLVFEWTSKDLGAQSAFLSGGRYNGLIESLGGPSTPAVGWAVGLERLNLLCEPFKRKPVQIGFAAIGEKAVKKAFQMIYELRAEGFSVYYRFSGNFSKQMKRISQKCLFALIYGEQEHSKREIILKDLSKGGPDRTSQGNFKGKYENQYIFPVSRLKAELAKKLTHTGSV